MGLDAGGTGQQDAGVTVFLQQQQHFDFGFVVAAENGVLNATGGDAGIYVRLRTTTTSSTNGDTQDPLSQFGMTKVAGESPTSMVMQPYDVYPQMRQALEIGTSRCGSRP